MTRPARVVFDSQAVRANLAVVRAHAPNRRVMAIIKADAYGHGLVRMARTLTGVDAFGVASLEEAVRLREANLHTPIVLLEGPFETAELPAITALGLESVVHNHAQVQMFEALAEPVPLWVKVDTGMHRLGFAPQEIPAVLEMLSKPTRALRLLTHFANAHLREGDSVLAQLDVLDHIPLTTALPRCCANSGAILAWPTTHAEWVRPGLMLYGVSPFPDVTAHELGLRPAMTVTSALIATRRIPAGERVGYGQRFVCPETMPVGIVAFGYADGYPRHASTGTPVLVRGIRTQIIGEVAMDMLAVDLRPLPDAQIGDPVVLWGEGLPVEEVANAASTIPYELLCRMRMRAHCVERP